jgi:integrase/recombinase XerD
MEKKFVSDQSVSLFYTEARLVKSQSNAKDKWYIFFSQGSDSSFLKPYRPTFDINRIRNRRERKVVADNIIDSVNEALEKGDSAEVIISNAKRIFKNGKVKQVVNPFPQRQKSVIEAIDDAYQLKIQDATERSKETYKHICDHFKRFLIAQKIMDKPIITFNKSCALGFMDFLWLRGIVASTYNNRLSEIKNLFNELVRRDYLIENPFTHIVEKKQRAFAKSKQRRRIFTDEEAKIVGMEIYEQSIWLFRAILLENYCGVRPTELRRLKFKHFRFSLGVIDLKEDVVFKSKPRVATIPKAAIEYFLMPDFTSQSAGNFVFGAKFTPNPNRPVSRNYITKKHREILLDLKSKGLLGDITGLELYSWKNKGITDYANDNDIGIFKTQNQVGHHSPTETMTYYRQSPVDEAIKKYDKKIF